MGLFISHQGVDLLGPRSYLPEKIVDNAELAAWMGSKVRPSFIEARTGIAKRHWAESGQATSDLAVAAAQALLDEFPRARKEIGQVLLATVSGDRLVPPTAPLVQHRLDLKDVGALDVGAACAAFPLALQLSASLSIGSGKAVLLIVADVRSKFLDKKDFATSVLFGDAASACLVIPHNPDNEGGYAVLATEAFCDGSAADLIAIEAGGSRQPFRTEAPGDTFLRMKNGPELFLRAVEGMALSATSFLAHAKLPLAEVDHVIPHQANGHLVSEVGKRLGLGAGRLIITVAEHGNTGGSTVGLALEKSRLAGRIKPGEKILLLAAGGGGLAAAALLQAR